MLFSKRKILLLFIINFLLSSQSHSVDVDFEETRENQRTSIKTKKKPKELTEDYSSKHSYLQKIPKLPLDKIVPSLRESFMRHPLGILFEDSLRGSRNTKAELSPAELSPCSFKSERKRGFAFLPEVIDLRNMFPPVHDQLSLKCCAALACGDVVTYLARRSNPYLKIDPGVLFIYYNTRLLEGIKGEHKGVFLKNTILSIKYFGVCPEEYTPFIDDGIAYKKQPSAVAYHKAKNYTIMDDIDACKIPLSPIYIKKTLAKGIPVVCGIRVYDSFESKSTAYTGIVPFPDLEKESSRGGHAILLVGYNSPEKIYYARNSWGNKWGKEGYCEIPERFIHNSKVTRELWKFETIKERTTPLPRKLYVSHHVLD